MMDFDERVIPGVTANFLYQEALARYEFASKFVKNRSKILDVGCGTGYGTDFLAKRAAFALGVDNNEDAIKFARKRYKNAQFMLGDAEKLEFKSKFDVICAFEIIEHLKKPKVFLRSVKKLLKKGGIFILSTPNKEVISQGGGVSSLYHTKEYNLKELAELLEKYFSRLEIYGQRKSARAKEAFRLFLQSQNARQKIVDSDILNIRKLLPESSKEKIWKYLGLLFGLASQRKLTIKDFPVSKLKKNSEYLVGVCHN